MGNLNRRKCFFYGTSIVAFLFLIFEGVCAWQVYSLPIVFGLLYFVYEYKFSRLKEGISFTPAIVVFMYWLRLVFLPVMAYTGVEDKTIDYSLPVFLTLYEFLVVTVFIFLFDFNDCSLKANKHCLELRGSSKVYFLYGILALGVYVLFARKLDLFDFFLKASNTVERGGDIIDSKSLVIREVINCGILFFYLFLVQYWRKKYDKYHRNLFLYYVLFISLMFLSIISGERRTSILYKAFAITVLLIQLFPIQKQKILKTIVLGAFVVLLLMTIYKSFHAYMYDSYVAALKEREVTDALGGRVFDSYFYGLRTIAKNLDFTQRTELSFINIIYDFLRSIFGLHFLIKDSGFTTSQLYNLSIYGYGQTNGYLFSGIAYGYAYFGLILSPLIPLFNVSMMVVVEKIMNKCCSIEMSYVCALIFIRFAFGFEGEYAPLINMVTRTLIIYGTFYYVSRLLKKIR